MTKKIILIIFLTLIQKFAFAELIYVSNEKDHNNAKKQLQKLRRELRKKKVL